MARNSKYELIHVSNDTDYINFVKEAYLSEIHPKYIDKIIISFTDGSISEIPGEEINAPIPVDNDLTMSKSSYNSSCIEHVQVCIDMRRLAAEVDVMVAKLLSPK